MNSTLYQQIQHFYDSSSGLWEDIWGEHLHHGYYGLDGTLKKERRQAQIDLIEELLNWGITATNSKIQILDVGCGIGGSSLYLAEKFQAQVTGITLSPVQAKRATERALEAGLQEKTQFLVADALEMPFEANSFDLVWSLESAEHFPNKIKFLQESYRVLKPGGTLLMATWCHRPLTGNAGQLTDAERLDSAFDFRAIVGLLLSGWTTIQAALALPLMSRGYETGLIRFGVLKATKPQ
jgi:tocopherol O-methyltransferase